MSLPYGLQEGGGEEKRYSATSTLDGYEWSDSRPGHFNPRKEPPAPTEQQAEWNPSYE
jgi:hypothetical protein